MAPRRRGKPAASVRTPKVAAKAPPAARRGGWGRRLRRWSALALLALALGGVLYVLYLDQVVRLRFEGKRWSLPARVYARPLELYAGAALSAKSLQAELERLGYTRSKKPDRPGTYSHYKERFLLRSRAFDFWDGHEPGHTLDVRFSGATLTGLKHADGSDAGLVRLDAALIDSIYPEHHEDRVLVRRDAVPELLVRTLTTVEDRHFFAHGGVDPVAIARAVWSNLLAGRVVQGGSTLTQQLVKNFYLNAERSLVRKFNEALMALLLDYRYDKDAILEAYANEIYLGQDGQRAIHGFGLAANFYFNRPLAELNLAQTALLVGMIKGPSYYNPRRHPERARARRDLVLDVLAQHRVIAPAAAEAAKRMDLGVSARGGRPAGRYPAFMQLVRQQIREDYREQDLRTEGLRIFTTLDPGVQALAEQAVAQRLQALEGRRGVDRLEAAVVVAGARNGEVLALVGGRRSGYSGFNRALEALRPIGSLIKPVVYLEALEQPERYTPVSLLKDTAVSLKSGGSLWRPRNFDGKVHGDVPLYLALARSYNLATVNLGLDLGVRAVVKRLRAMGVKSAVEPVPAVLLGAVSLSPLEVAQLYQSLAGDGFRSPLRAVREVSDARGRPLGRYPLQVEQVASPEAVCQLNWALREVVEQGTGRGLQSQLPAGLTVAGKTGTTDDYRDSWFAGFSGDKVAVVWVGRDDNRPAGLSGAAGALRVWGDVIGATDSRPLDLPLPAGVELVTVDATGGLRADAGCSGALDVPFVRGSAPARFAACAGAVEPAPRATEPGRGSSHAFMDIFE